MSDPKWPDEPFTAKHTASGTPVKVTPVDMGEPNLLPQSMRIGKGQEQELHWADVEHTKVAAVREKLSARGFTFTTATLFSTDVCDALLTLIERLEVRIAKLEAPHPPEGT